MVVCVEERIHAVLRVGGQPTLVFEISGIDWFQLGEATLIASPILCHRHLGRKRPTAQALQHATRDLFGQDIIATSGVAPFLECYVKAPCLHGALLATDSTTVWRAGRKIREPFSPDATHVPITCLPWSGEAPRGALIDVRLLRPWLSAPVSPADAARQLALRMAPGQQSAPASAPGACAAAQSGENSPTGIWKAQRGEHVGSSRQRQRVKPAERNRKRSRTEPGAEDPAAGLPTAHRGRPSWHAWAAAGFRLLPGGGALNGCGEPIAEPLLESVATEGRLPWPVAHRPAWEESAALLAIAPLDASPSTTLNDCASNYRRTSTLPTPPPKKRRIDYGIGRVMWLKDANGCGNGARNEDALRPMRIESHDGALLLLRPLPLDGTALVSIERTAVVEFGTGLAAVWNAHSGKELVRKGIEDALQLTHRQQGRAREPRLVWERHGGGVPFPF